MTQFLTVHDLATRWQRPAQWVRLHAPDFGGTKIGDQWRFDPALVETYETRRRATTTDHLTLTAGSAARQKQSRR